MPKKPKAPRLFVIAGPNGAGKTTFARRFLPHYAECDLFVNADLIAAGLSPFAPDVVAIKAGRLMLEQIEFFAELRRDFAFETTLSGRTYLSFLLRMRTDGYRISLYFLWLRNAELAIARIDKRVQEGGHHVPDDVVRRRYDRGLRNLFQVYRPVLDHWAVFDNSEGQLVPVAQGNHENTRVLDRPLFEFMTKGMEGL